MLSRNWRLSKWRRSFHACSLSEDSELFGDGECYKNRSLESRILECGAGRQLAQARLLHEQISSSSGLHFNAAVGNLLVQMFTKCGSLQDCWSAFNKIKSKDSDSFAAMISACEQLSCDGWSSIQLFKTMSLEGFKPGKSTFVNLVSSTCSTGDSTEARRVHLCLSESGYEFEVGNRLLNMYIKCCSLFEARQVFNKLDKRDIVCWTALMGAYAQQGFNVEALELYHRLNLEGLRPDAVTFVEVIRACTNLEALEQGTTVHGRLVVAGYGDDEVLGNAVVHMYGKCGELAAAREVFDRLGTKRVTAWNTMITAYSKEGRSSEAVGLYKQMMVEGTKPNYVTFLGVLGACSKDYYKPVHDCLAATGLETHLVVGTALVTMYGRTGELEQATEVFEKMELRNVVTWNAMITAYSQYADGVEALRLLKRMDQEGVRANRVSFVGLLGACNSPDNLLDGQAIHARVLATGSSDEVVDSAVLNMYCKCGSLEQARQVLHGMRPTSLVPWTTMLAAYAQQGEGLQAVQLYHKMDLEGIKPDEVTLVNVLTACSSRQEGTAVHHRIAAAGFRSIVVDSNLVIMYSRLGELVEAVAVFEQMERRDTCCCTAMIATYAQHGKGREALMVFQKMDQEGLKADHVTYAAVLDACSKAEAVEAGSLVHQRIEASGIDDPYVTTALVSMYSKCGDLEKARSAFDKVAVRSVACWNTMLSAYTQQGRSREALMLYQGMEADCVQPDELTYVAVVTACCNLGSLRDGRPIHDKIIMEGLESGPMVSTTLVNMYGKCGSLREARKVFDKWCKANIVAWNCLILAYASNGREQEGLELYRMMNQEGVEPNEVTMTCLLFACSHGGMVEAGWKQFLDLTNDSDLVLRGEHYSCMIDLLGRVGRLEEAEQFIRSLPQAAATATSAAWMALLNACQMHGDVDRADRVSQTVIDLNPERSATYVLLANIYAAAKRWKDVSRVRKLMEDMWLRKQARLDAAKQSKQQQPKQQSEVKSQESRATSMEARRRDG